MTVWTIYNHGTDASSLKTPDTGEIVNDISLPIYLGPEHWGAVRIGLDYGRFQAVLDGQGAGHPVAQAAG